MNRWYHLKPSPFLGTRPRLEGECAPSWSVSDGGPNVFFTNVLNLPPGELDPSWRWEPITGWADVLKVCLEVLKDDSYELTGEIIATRFDPSGLSELIESDAITQGQEECL